MSQHASPRISVHGDGISTFAGVTDNTLSYYFDRSSATSGFSTADGTWWMKTVQLMGGSFVGNGSAHGSYVSMTGQYPAFLPGRIRKLQDGDVTPELILVYTGINDVIDNIELEPFRRDYAKMLENLKSSSPRRKSGAAPWSRAKAPSSMR